MKKIDFSAIAIQLTIEGEPAIKDVRKDLGNILYQGNDVAVSDFGKQVYYSEGPIGVPHHLINPICQVVMTSTLIAPAKVAIVNVLNKEEE